MKKNLASSVSILIALLSRNVSATTWGPPESKPDPVIEGATCQVSEPMSWGSYIYQWPSKYDQVFWPLTDPHALWFCEQSGFTAFIGDFALTAQERAALAEHLRRVYQPVAGRPTVPALLELLRESYSKRQTDDELQLRLLRVLAYVNDEFQDYEAAARFRREALARIEDALATNLEEGRRLEYLFVAAAYYREFGDEEKSDRKLEALRGALDSSSNEKLKGYVEYLTELKKDIAQIEPGGPLAPARNHD